MSNSNVHFLKHVNMTDFFSRYKICSFAYQKMREINGCEIKLYFLKHYGLTTYLVANTKTEKRGKMMVKHQNAFRIAFPTDYLVRLILVDRPAEEEPDDGLDLPVGDDGPLVVHFWREWR